METDNKIIKKEKKEEIKENQENQEPKQEIKKEINIKTIRNDPDVDYSKTIREGILDISSYTMPHPEKQKRFSKDLKDNETLNTYIDEQLYLRFFRTNNPHIRSAVIYSYLYMKNLNTL